MSMIFRDHCPAPLTNFVKPLAGVVLAASLSIGAPASAQDQPQRILPPNPTSTDDNPHRILGFLTLAVLVGLGVGVQAIPSKRGHQD
ncbi:MAG: hypothetical protein AAF747_00525 [Planctomycetota bacterium]